MCRAATRGRPAYPCTCFFGPREQNKKGLTCLSRTSKVRQTYRRRPRLRCVRTTSCFTSARGPKILDRTIQERASFVWNDRFIGRTSTCPYDPSTQRAAARSVAVRVDWNPRRKVLGEVE